MVHAIQRPIEATSSQVRRLSRTDAVRRYAGQHPYFRVSTHLPDYFREMLCRLENEEGRLKR